MCVKCTKEVFLSVRDEKNSERYEPDGWCKSEPASVESSARINLHCRRRWLHLSTRPDINRPTNADLTSCLKTFKDESNKIAILISSEF